MRIKIGKNAYLGKHGMMNDYYGLVGEIEMCKTCCNANRIKFFGMANNEPLSNFDILRCELSVTTHPKRGE